MDQQNAAPGSVDPKNIDEHTAFDMAWAKNVHQFDVDAVEPQKHEPYQDGSFIKCKTPGHEHGFHIGPLKQLVMKDGKPAIVDVVPDRPQKAQLKTRSSMLYN